MSDSSISPLPWRGLDVLAPLNRESITRISANDFKFVMRYLKNVSSAEIDNLHKAGLKVGMIWETTATRSLQGASAGKYDGQGAVTVMQRYGAPAEAVVYATVDQDVNTDAQLSAVEDYFIAFTKAVAGKFQVGGYANGAALTWFKDDGMLHTWLAGAMGWTGSRDFAKTGNPSLLQGPTLGVSGGSWHGINWPGLGFQYDPDIAFVEDFGAW